MINELVADRSFDVIAFWDGFDEASFWSGLDQFLTSLDDVWTPSSEVPAPDALDLMRYAMPLWVYRGDNNGGVDNTVTWKLTLRRGFFRARVLRALNGLATGYSTLEGAALDLGFRLIQTGAVCRQERRLGVISREPIALADRYRLVGARHGTKWLTYTLARRIGELENPINELRAFAQARRTPAIATVVEPTALNRDLSNVEVEAYPAVSVILPTFGRYRYVAEVLDDLRNQTIKPTQILIADGNAPQDRQPEVYERYRDLPIEVIWHEEEGTCSGRNACLERSTGKYIWFVDDDSRFGADNLEAHLRVLAGYGADVSVGPAYTRSRPELYGNQKAIVCTFMDCGTTVCRRSLLEQVGGFDMQFNRWLVNEDGELGLRFIRAGGLMVNNPLAKRFHYYAPVGGSRSPQSVHKFSRWSKLPRPAQSYYYTAKRYFEPGTTFDAVFQAAALYGWRRKEGQKASPAWRARTLLGELAAIPLTAWRVRKSVRLGAKMVHQGPKIPEIVPVTNRKVEVL